MRTYIIASLGVTLLIVGAVFGFLGYHSFLCLACGVLGVLGVMMLPIHWILS